MRVRDYQSIDLKTLQAWLSKRDVSLEVAKDLPSVGVIAFGDADLAMGFLRQTEGNQTVWVEGLTTNPAGCSDERSLAIQAVIDELTNRAKQLGAKNIMGFTREHTIFTRILERGWKFLPQALVGLILEKGN